MILCLLYNGKIVKVLFLLYKATIGIIGLWKEYKDFSSKSMEIEFAFLAINSFSCCEFHIKLYNNTLRVTFGYLAANIRDSHHPNNVS